MSNHAEPSTTLPIGNPAIPGEYGNEIFDPTVAARHEYLGDFEDLQGGCSILEEGFDFTLPALAIPDVVLMPGSTLPMILSDPSELSVLNAALNEPLPSTRLIVVVCRRLRQSSSHEGLADLIGCTAEIRQLRRQDNGSVCIMVKGRQRVLRLGSGEEGASEPWDPWVRDYDPWGAHHSMRVRVLPDGDVTRMPKEIAKRQTHIDNWAARPFDPIWLSTHARNMCASVLPATSTSGHLDEVRGVLELSYWLASNLPLGVESRISLLQSHSSSDRLRKEIQLLKSLGSVRCRVCLAKLAEAGEALQITEEGVGGAFVNAHGHVHDLATFKSVSHDEPLMYQGRPVTEHSWFPGFSWLICNCSTCFQHLGWRFDAVQPGLKPARFWGLRRPALASGLAGLPYEQRGGIGLQDIESDEQIQTTSSESGSDHDDDVMERDEAQEAQVLVEHNRWTVQRLLSLIHRRGQTDSIQDGMNPI